MRHDPYVTVIIPAFNAERTIEETISSVLAQTFTDFELIIINDGSIDGTVKIVEQRFLSDPRVSLINQQNGGTAAARNRGISAARSDLIAPLDSDDLWHPTYLEKQLHTLGQHDTAGFVYAWSRFIDHESRVFETPHYPFVAGRALRRLLYWNFVGNGSAIIFKKSSALQFGCYDTTRIESVEDLMLQIKLAARHECVVTSEYLVGYRRRPGQKSGNFERTYRSQLRILELIENECAGIEKKAINWRRGEKHFGHAVRAYLDGRLRDAVRLLGLAYQSDPLGASYHVGSFVYNRGRRLIHRSGRRLPSTPVFAAGTPFFQAPTDEIVQPVRSALWHNRLAYLRQLDEQQALPTLIIKGRPSIPFN